MCFHLDESTGNVNFSINGTLVAQCLFNVDITQQLYFFFDLCGKINAIRLIPQCRSSTTTTNQTPQQLNQTASSQLAVSSSSSTKRQSALIDYFKSQLNVSDGSSSSNQEGNRTNRDSIDETNSPREECRICLDAPIECVFYVCGHMCLCWNW